MTAAEIEPRPIKAMNEGQRYCTGKYFLETLFFKKVDKTFL